MTRHYINIVQHNLHLGLMAIVMEKEPDLPEVHADDRMLIRNIIYTVMALNTHDPFSKGWHVQCKPNGYVVIFYLMQNYTIALRDLQMVHDLNPGRITNTVVCSETECSKQDPTTVAQPVLRIQVLNSQQPVLYSEIEIVRVSKRYRSNIWSTHH